MSLIRRIIITTVFFCCLAQENFLWPMRKFSEQQLNPQQIKKQSIIYNFYKDNVLKSTLNADLNTKKEYYPFHNKHFRLRGIEFNKDNEYKIKTKIVYTPFLKFIDICCFITPENKKKTYYISDKKDKNNSEFLKAEDEQTTYVTNFKKCGDKECSYLELKEKINNMNDELNNDLIIIYKYYQLALGIKKIKNKFGLITPEYGIYKVTNFKDDSFADVTLIRKIDEFTCFDLQNITYLFFSYDAQTINVLLTDGKLYTMLNQ